MTRLIRPADWRDMPWRNGGGVTSEIAAERQGDAIVWRLSTAIVDRDGAYSPFPGCQRISTVIQGRGTALDDPGGSVTVEIPPLTPTLLDGEIAWDGRLFDGPIRHLNLIFDPKRVRASVEMLKVDGAASLSGGVSALFCVSGACSAAGERLAPHDVLLDVPAQPVHGEATLVLIGLLPVHA